jgi:hypothetical protein
MKINKRIQAFTLSEMVVVLILTSIVVGLAFSVLNLVQKHMLSIKSNFINHTEMNKLEQSLWIDFNRYSNVEYYVLEDEIQFRNPMDSIRYQFQENYIIKGIDTFDIEVQNKTIFYEGKKRESGVIDALKLKFSKNFQNQLLFIFKENDATLFIN